jgi:hypothetical protein
MLMAQMEYRSIGARLRPPRFVVGYCPGDDWIFNARHVVASISRVWGGNQGSGKVVQELMIVRSGRLGLLAWQRRAAAILAAPASRTMVIARHTGHDAQAAGGADLRAAFVEGHAADPAQAVIDDSVAADDGGELSAAGLGRKGKMAARAWSLGSDQAGVVTAMTATRAVPALIPAHHRRVARPHHRKNFADPLVAPRWRLAGPPPLAAVVAAGLRSQL